jgi:hypothetical protein
MAKRAHLDRFHPQDCVKATPRPAEVATVLNFLCFLLSSRLYGWMSWTFSLASDVYGSPLSMLYAPFDVLLSCFCLMCFRLMCFLF